MKTAKQTERTAQTASARTVRRAGASTKVRPRCRGTRQKEEYVRRELQKAMPEIVSAHIEKARKGSLIHTKWLWGVADKAPDKGAVKRSLAEMLLERLEQDEAKQRQ